MVLALVAGIAAALAFYRQMNNEIRCRVEDRIARHYSHLKVRVRSAELVEGKGIRIRDLSISEPGVADESGEIFHVEEALLECSTDWQELIKGDPAMRRIILRRATLRAARRADGVWSVAKLLPPPQFGDHPPEVSIVDSKVEILDPQKHPASKLTLRDGELSIIPTPANAPLALTKETVAQEVAALKPGSRRLRGSFAGEGFRRIEFEGAADFRAGTYSIRGSIEAMEVSPELRETLPDPLASKLRTLGDLRGQSDLQFQIGREMAGAPWQYDVVGRFTRGRIDDSRWPHGLTDIRAAVHIDNSGYAIDNLVARSGEAIVRLACRRLGFDSNSPLTLAAEVRKLKVDRSLLNILPRDMQNLWLRYRPTGEIDADVKFSFDGKTWQPELTAQCLNVSFMYAKFPHQLEHGKGTVTLKDDRVTLDLTAYSGRQPVRLEADVSHPFTSPTGWFEAKGDAIELSEPLIAALPEKPLAVVRSLDPRGAVDVYLRIWRDQPDEKMHKHYLFGANRCSIRYEKFPYAISNVRGTLEMLDDVWTFRGIEGTNDKARITCEGRLTPGFQGNELLLNLVGENVVLTEELRNALSPHIQQVWHDMRPQGTVDLTAEIRYLSESKQFSVGVQLSPQPESASIEPVHFPYRLDRLQGVLHYRDGHVTFQRCKGEHGAVKLSTEGYCDFRPEGRWNIHFANLSVDRLRADRELIQALPDQLRKAVVELNPTGTINLRGSLDLQRSGKPNEPLRSSWDMRVGMVQSNLQCGGIPLENVHGVVLLQGGCDGRRLQTRGELIIDSLHYKNFQFTQLTGPVWIDDGRVLFGSWVDRRENKEASAVPARTQRPLTATLFGGKFFADGWVTFGPESRYAVNATLTDADLTRCSREIGAGQHNLRGKIIATADLAGSGRSRNNLSGKGVVRLSDGDVYELPLMAALLKMLGVRPADDRAFSAASIDYHIEGEHIYFDQINFHGDAMSLYGKGEMDFQSTIRLTFHAMVGRGELDLPVLKQVFSGASQQIMLIHVDGNLQNPEVRREALPAVNQALQQLRGESDNRR